MRPYSKEEFVSRFWSRVEKTAACWVWKGANGYGSLGSRHFPGVQRPSRLSWILTNGPIPPGMQVCHRCDNPPCVNPAHLFLGTHDDNMRDKAAKGRASRLCAERNPKARLTRAQADQIRALKSDKYGAVSRVARQFSISRGVVRGIWAGKYWATNDIQVVSDYTEKILDKVAPRMVVTVEVVP